MNPEPHMVHEQVVITMDSIGIAFRITWLADQLLDAVLNGTPKARLIRDLAVDLDRFNLYTFLGCEKAGALKVDEAMSENSWDTAKLDGRVLILERDVPEDESAPEYWPGHDWKDRDETPVDA